MTTLSGAVRRKLLDLGLDVRRVRPLHNEFEILTHLLRQRGVTNLVDIGANRGQFAQNMRRGGYVDSLISFEPMPEEHAALSAAATGDPKWLVPAAVALSDAPGDVEFHVAGNSVSSSILPMDELHVSTAPRSRIVATIRVPTARLDAVLGELLPNGTLFLKLDVQGFERVVLDGATGILDRIAGIKTEMSFAKLYEGQVLFDEFHAHIRTLGFDLWDITPGLRNPESGRLLQSDFVYLRP